MIRYDRHEGAKLTRRFAARNVRYPDLSSYKETFRIVRHFGRSTLVSAMSAFGKSVLKRQCPTLGRIAGLADGMHSTEPNVTKTPALAA